VIRGIRGLCLFFNFKQLTILPIDTMIASVMNKNLNLRLLLNALLLGCAAVEV
jgi:hypothetical protein